MTEMMAVLIYNDQFRIRTITHTYFTKRKSKKKEIIDEEKFKARARIFPLLRDILGNI